MNDAGSVVSTEDVDGILSDEVMAEGIAVESPPEPDIPKSVQKLLDFHEMDNIAATLTEDELNKIADTVCEEYEIDKDSREEWEKTNKENIELARLLYKQKNTPWPNASNVKFPTITRNCLQFSSRAYSSIIKNDQIVKEKPIGKDPDGKKKARAIRIAEHMNYQLTEKMNWLEETDRAITAFPVIGTMFKKIFRNETLNRNESIYVSAENVVVNYFEKNDKNPNRLTHIYELYPNEIEERKRSGVFLDLTYIRESGENDSGDDAESERDKDRDKDAPHVFLEQHRYLDLDGDGYKEPYIVVLHKGGKKIARIVARYDIDAFEVDLNDKILHIESVEYFTKTVFWPAFDGSYYGIGLASFLNGMNRTINSLLNQLIDAGTKANKGGGIIDRRLTKANVGSQVPIKMGEYLVVDGGLDGFSKGIFEFTIKEPSPALYSLVNLLIETSMKSFVNADLMGGETPPAGVPYSSTITMLREGMKIFGVVFQRIHRGLREEFKKLMRLNRLYLTEEEYATVLDEVKTISVADYDMRDCDVVPVSDPKNASDLEQMPRAEALMALRGIGLNDEEIVKNYLEAMELPDIPRYFQDGKLNPPPNPELMIEQGKLELAARKAAIDERKMKLSEEKGLYEKLRIKMDAVLKQSEAIKAIAEAESKEAGLQLEQYKAETQDINEEMAKLLILIDQQGEMNDRYYNELQELTVPAEPTGEVNEFTDRSVNTEPGLGKVVGTPGDEGVSIQGAT